MRNIICFIFVIILPLISGCSFKKEETKIEDIHTSTENATSIRDESSYVILEAITFSDVESDVESYIEAYIESDVESDIESAVEHNYDFVSVKDYIPSIKIDLKYATNENISGVVIYKFTDAYLRYGTVKKIEKVQNALLEKGYSLKIWDGFRPIEAQFALWEAYPNSAYVANPNTGYSSHSRGNTVDVTIVDIHGDELEMPTKFDDFSDLADRNYDDCTPEARKNALLLENVMKENGFKAYHAEWWHFTDSDTYPIEKNFAPENQ